MFPFVPASFAALALGASQGVDDGWAEAGAAVKESAFPTSDCGLEDCYSVPQS